MASIINTSGTFLHHRQTGVVIKTFNFSSWFSPWLAGECGSLEVLVKDLVEPLRLLRAEPGTQGCEKKKINLKSQIYEHNKLVRERTPFCFA